MCPTGLQGAVHSRQVHQFTQEQTLTVVWRTLFSVTDITSLSVYRKEPPLKYPYPGLSTH